MRNIRIYAGGFLAASVALSGVCYIIQGAAAALDRATAHQCATRDWPADKAAATQAWCLDNGYALGTD